MKIEWTVLQTEQTHYIIINEKNQTNSFHLSFFNWERKAINPANSFINPFELQSSIAVNSWTPNLLTDFM